MARRGNTLLVPAGAVVVTLVLAACGGSRGSATATAHPSTGATTTNADPSPPTTAHPAPRHSLVTARHAPPTGLVITTRTSQYGSILTDGANRTIYLFTRDRSSVSVCYGLCAAVWPPVLTNGAAQRRDGLAAALGTTRRRDRTVQVTYNGHPLYYYVGDARAGEILCQNVVEFGGTWLVVSPRGTAVR